MAHQASASSAVTSGTDGEFRMTVDRRYKDMAAHRKYAIRLFPLWVLVSVLKVAWLAAPYVVGPQFVRMAALAVHALTFVGGLISWPAGNIWGQRERFGFVIVFNIFVLVGVSMHIATRFRYYTENLDTHVEDSRVLTVALLKLVPSIDATASPRIRGILEPVEMILDVGFLGVGALMGTFLHHYITDKKEVNKDKKEREAALAAKKAK